MDVPLRNLRPTFLPSPVRTSPTTLDEMMVAVQEACGLLLVPAGYRAHQEREGRRRPLPRQPQGQLIVYIVS